MRAIQILAYGGPEVVVCTTLERPQPQDEQVLVRVHAAGVNPVDWKIRDGLVKDHLPVSPPLVLGCDISGTVEAVGSQVSGLRVGDAVFGQVGLYGAFAEFAVTTASRLALKPASLDHLAAASIPVAGLTAWQGLFREGGLQAGQRVLIHAAAGGVGSFAVQLAHRRGAYVIASTSAANADYARSLGADEVIDFRQTPFEAHVRDLDLVFDLLGGETQRRSWATLRPGGRLVSTVGPPAAHPAAAGVQGGFVIGAPDAEGRDLRELAALAASGALRSSVQTVLPLAEASQALELSKSGHVRGKIVLRVSD